PVHRMSKDFLPSEVPQVPTYLVIYRNEMDDIQFMEINGVTASLISQLQELPHASGWEILQSISRQLDMPDEDSIIAAGLESLKLMQSRGIILGAAQ
ncbi:MAG: DUF2063 domain-containing protein, partial [Gammaproteobacteria bacterium]|nr:DUF2063 domain-containing protein [Gammaproteobacteria bacterium]